MARPACVLLLAALLLAAAPVAAQEVGIDNPYQPTPTTLYFHLHAYQDFPINTQPPDDRYADHAGRGLLAPTASCVPDAQGALGAVSRSYHTFYGFSTPGYVQYDVDERGGPRIHPERGLADDVHLDVDAPATAYWYIETQFTGGDGRVPGAAGLDDLPVFVPRVVVEVTMRTGDQVSIGAAAYNEGQIIAHGKSAPLDLAPVPSEHYLPQEDGSHVYEFRVPLSFQMDLISRLDAYNVRVDVHVEMPPCDQHPDEAIMTSNVRVHTSPELRPRMELSILNPLKIIYVHPQFVGESLYIHTGFNSPWGNYDVDERPGGVVVEITGPSAAPNLVRAAVVQRVHEHGHHFEPVDMTYVWPYVLDQARNGEYVVTVTAQNDQATAQAVARAAFELGPNTAVDADGNPVLPTTQDGERKAPAAGALAALALLGTAVVVARRPK